LVFPGRFNGEEEGRTCQWQFKAGDVPIIVVKVLSQLFSKRMSVTSALTKIGQWKVVVRTLPSYRGIVSKVENP